MLWVWPKKQKEKKKKRKKRKRKKRKVRIRTNCGGLQKSRKSQKTWAPKACFQSLLCTPSAAVLYFMASGGRPPLIHIPTSSATLRARKLLIFSSLCPQQLAQGQLQSDANIIQLRFGRAIWTQHPNLNSGVLLTQTPLQVQLVSKAGAVIHD